MQVLKSLKHYGLRAASTGVFPSSTLRSRTLAMVSHFSPPLEDDTQWQHVQAHNSTPAHFVYSKEMQKSPQDDRSYRVIRLENGLQAVLVHDPKADKAAASLNVAVGHLNDPVRLILTERIAVLELEA